MAQVLLLKLENQHPQSSTGLTIIILFSRSGLSLFLSEVLTEFWTEKPCSQGALDTGITGLIKASCTKSG